MSGMKKKFKIAIISITALSAVLFLGFTAFLGKQIVAGSTQLVTNEKTSDVHKEHFEKHDFDYDAFSQAYTIEKLELKSSFDEHIIPADYIHSDKTDKGTVIMIHGLGGNRKTTYLIAEFFLQNGYSVIAYDQRSSGENTAEKTTFGVWEKYDLIDCIKYAKTIDPNKKIGVWGESFGGATAIQGVAYEQVQDDVAFMILDCPVGNMEWMVSEEMKSMDMGIPLEYMIWAGNMMNKITLGFSYDDADATELAKNIHIPTLIINSEVDDVTPYFMGKDIFDNLSSKNKDLWTVKDSKHVEMWFDHNEEYRNKVLKLIDSI